MLRPRRGARIAAARANQLPRATESARAIAEHLVRKAVGTGLAPRIRFEAAALAAWTMVGRAADGGSEPTAPAGRAREPIVL